MIALLPIIGILANVADSVLSYVTKNKAPQEIIDAVVAVTAAVSALHDTAVTKAQLESQRG